MAGDIMSPPTSTEPSAVAERLLAGIGLELISCDELQALWAGYGHICALRAKPAAALGRNGGGVPQEWAAFSSGDEVHLILKIVAPRGGAREDEGHLRKMLSYRVEQRFYEEVAPRLGEESAVARCLASTRGGDDDDGLTATVMSDLRLEFPLCGERRGALSSTQVHAALRWLAGFHGDTWRRVLRDLSPFLLPPLEEAKRREEEGEGGSALWLNGGYTYLATRRTEYESLAVDTSSEWCAAFCDPMPGVRGSGGSGDESTAELVARFLTPRGRPFESYIHGDVKSENLFSDEAGERVAFFDFQYVGLGLGVCDLAKLFTCSVPQKMLISSLSSLSSSYSPFSSRTPDKLPMGDGEKALLERYLDGLRLYMEEEEEDKLAPGGRRPYRYEWDAFRRHWETALVDWCRFQASWGFWGNTEWLQARVRWILADEGWRGWLLEQSA